MASSGQPYRAQSSAENFKKPTRNTGIYLLVFLLVAGFLVLIGFVFLLAGSQDSSFLASDKCIAVVDIDQELTTQHTDPSILSQGAPGSEDIAKAIEALNKRDEVGSVLFVINSPGGGVVASREIYLAVEELKKPKVGYFREVAASGGYYISAPLDYIISDPNAITGSIGVIATFSDMSGLFEKVGFNVTAIKSGSHKDIGSPSRPLTDEEKAILQNIVNETFSEFKSVVITHRGSKLNSDRFEEILDGRIITGRQAKEVGLVDAVGTKKDAIKKAAALGGISNEDPRLCKVSFGTEDKSLFGLSSVFQGLMNSNQKRVALKFE